MCNPALAVAGIGLVMSAAGTAVSIKQQRDAAQSQYDAAVEADAINQATLNNRQQELNDKVQLDKFERMRQQWRDEAKIMTSAAEGGVVGQSVTEMLHTAELGATYDINIMSKSKDTNARQTQNERLRSRSNSRSLINEANSRVPSALTSGLQIGGSAIQGAAQGYTLGQKIDSLKGDS